METLARWIVRTVTRLTKLFQRGRIHYGTVLYGFVGSRALMTGVALGLFDALKDGPRERDEVVAELGLDPEAARVLFDTCVVHNLLACRRGRYSLRRPFARWLEEGGVRADILHLRLLYDDLSELEGCARGDWPEASKVAAFWGCNYTELSTEESARYTDFMRGTVSRSAAAMVAAYPFESAGSVLDVGGSSGALAALLATTHPGLRVGILDLPAVEAQARALLAEQGLSERVIFVPGNFLELPLPTGWDTMLLHRVLWDWSDELAAILLRRIFTALPAGGKLLVTEAMWCGDDDLDALLSHFHLYLRLGGFQLRSRAGVRVLLQGAGFVDIEERPVLPIYMPLMVATKPA
jgi:demethylspheroidene O-methyltransferase